MASGIVPADIYCRPVWANCGSGFQLFLNSSSRLLLCLLLLTDCVCFVFFFSETCVTAISLVYHGVLPIQFFPGLCYLLKDEASVLE